MKKALMVVSVLVVAVISTACINNIAVQELNNKAAEYMQKGDYESAMNRLQASLDLDSTMYQTYYNLGVAAIKAKKYDTAIEALNNGIKVNPEYPDFYYSLGIAQTSAADEITDNESEETELSEQQSIIENNKQEELKKVLALKHDAIMNFDKYLSKVPNTKDRSDIEKMIEEAEEFIVKYNKEQSIRDDAE